MTKLRQLTWDGKYCTCPDCTHYNGADNETATAEASEQAQISKTLQQEHQENKSR